MTEKRYQSELTERLTTWKGRHGDFLLRVLACAAQADSIGDLSLGEALRMLLGNRTSPMARLDVDGPALIYQKFDGEGLDLEVRGASHCRCGCPRGQYRDGCACGCHDATL